MISARGWPDGDAWRRLATAAVAALGLAFAPHAVAAPQEGSGTAAPHDADGGLRTLAVALPATLTAIGTAGAALGIAGLWWWGADSTTRDAWGGVTAGFGALALLAPETGYWISGAGARGGRQLALRLATAVGSGLVGYLVGLAFAPDTTCTPERWLCEFDQLAAWAIEGTAAGAFLAAGNLACAIAEWVDTDGLAAAQDDAAGGGSGGTAWNVSPVIGRGPDGSPRLGATLAVRF